MDQKVTIAPYRIRAITVDGGAEDTITVGDLDKYIDDHDGGPPRCSLKRHPYEFEAEHRETIGLHLPGQPFAKPARYPLVFDAARRIDRPWRRPWGELTSRATYRPDRQTYATLQRDDQAIIDEIDAAIEALLKTGACSAPTIARMAATEILGHHPITNIENRDIRFDAYSRMAGRKRYLPGLKDYGHPIADALQVSFWILQLDAETSIRTETPEEKRRRKCEQFLWTEKSLSSPKRGAPDGIMVTSDAGRELLRDIHPDRELLKRFLPPKWRRTKKDDVTAARIVTANTSSILYFAQKDRQRWHYDDDGTAKTDETIIRLLLRDRLTAREIAARLGLDDTGSGVIKRFKAAIAQISDVVGPLPKSTREEVAEKVNVPFKTLFPQIGVFVRNIEAGKSLAVDDALREEAARSYDKASKKIWPPISHVWPSAKVPLWSTGWFNDSEVRNRAPRLFVLVRKWSPDSWRARGWWTTEEEVVNGDIFSDGIWSGDPNAVWRQVPENDFTSKYRLARGQPVRAPRSYSTSIRSLNFCGPVVEKDGKVWPRAYGSNRIIAGGGAVDDAWLSVETVSRFERSMDRADPFFPDGAYNATETVRT